MCHQILIGDLVCVVSRLLQLWPSQVHQSIPKLLIVTITHLSGMLEGHLFLSCELGAPEFQPTIYSLICWYWHWEYQSPVALDVVGITEKYLKEESVWAHLTADWFQSYNSPIPKGPADMYLAHAWFDVSLSQDFWDVISLCCIRQRDKHSDFLVPGLWHLHHPVLLTTCHHSVFEHTRAASCPSSWSQLDEGQIQVTSHMIHIMACSSLFCMPPVRFTTARMTFLRTIKFRVVKCQTTICVVLRPIPSQRCLYTPTLVQPSRVYS